jgi:hypothetical protein
VYVGEIGGKKMCVEGFGKGDVFEILRNTWHVTSLLDVWPCNVMMDCFGPLMEMTYLCSASKALNLVNLLFVI